ncbi:hypothetical protein L6452_30123 [Arctium lappa]|uniref:Uncharacterized protein n=1 Tax=Arctium lappa TaxID=4217 RepID=A0ACB8ZIB0_ARCLA|nr:hypothetical protein L6452_30123 [Arctium lappa]
MWSGDSDVGDLQVSFTAADYFLNDYFVLLSSAKEDRLSKIKVLLGRITPPAGIVWQCAIWRAEVCSCDYDGTWETPSAIIYTFDLETSSTSKSIVEQSSTQCSCAHWSWGPRVHPSTSSGVALLKANGVEMEKEVSTMEVEKNMDVSRFVQYGRNNDSPILQEEIVKAGLELVEASKREELEEKWKKLKKQELQLYVMRMELLKEQLTLVYEAVNSSGN